MSNIKMNLILKGNISDVIQSLRNIRDSFGSKTKVTSIVDSLDEIKYNINDKVILSYIKS